MTPRIRVARPDDAPVIVEFNAAIARETEGRELDRALLGPGVAALLADPAKGRYFVAELDGAVVGQTMVTWEWSDWRNGTFWWIQSVYVAPAHRRQGVFGALYRHVYDAARGDPGVCGVRLYMEHHNERARRVYLALGMQASGYEVLEVDFRAPPASAA
jgi:GNAT superfamily N-acetyltransferase